MGTILSAAADPLHRAEIIFGFILGPMIEENLRRAMLLSRGDPTIFLTRPISAAFLVATVAFVVLMVLPSVRRNRPAEA